MRTFLRRLAASLLFLAVAAPAGAKSVPWSGTLVLELGTLPALVGQGAGVATVNSTSGSDALNTLRLAGGIAALTTVPVTDPEVTGQIKSVVIDATLGSGTLSGIAGKLPGATPPGQITGARALPVIGTARVCILVPGCTYDLELQLTANDGNTGVGVGGQLTLGRLGAIRFSIVANPWTLGTGQGVSQTGNGGFVTKVRQGFVHGPASNTSTTLLHSGIVQLITPMQVSTIGVPGNNEKLQLFGTLTLHFVPEPGLLLLLGSGAVGLALLGRTRRR